jgi:hypothetical protein
MILEMETRCEWRGGKPPDPSPPQPNHLLHQEGEAYRNKEENATVVTAISGGGDNVVNYGDNINEHQTLSTSDVPGTLVWAQYPLSSLTLTTTF